jgi:hypothetical protein
MVFCEQTLHTVLLDGRAKISLFLCDPPIGFYQPIITINVPVVFMARYVMVLRGATSLQGPTPSNAPSNDVAPLNTIKYKRLKNNWYIGSFMYPSAFV